MPNETLISFDLRADFGIFKKPDVNDGLQITFNLLHKPALLGILGAIAGLGGYEKRGVFPEFWEKLRHLRVGIEPLDHEKGNFTKTVIKYNNTVGYANADGGILNITEQTLRSPAYRVYLLLDRDDATQSLLHDRILAGEAEFLPYFGKNECSAWWDSTTVKTWKTSIFVAQNDFRVSSTFVRQYPLRSQKVEPRLSFSQRGMLNASSFAYFERLPIDFSYTETVEKINNQPNLFEQEIAPKSFKNERLTFVQYNLAEFAFTDWVLEKNSIIADLFEIETADQPNRIIQLY